MSNIGRGTQKYEINPNSLPCTVQDNETTISLAHKCILLHLYLYFKTQEYFRFK